jgi:vitamin B12 transporter
MLWRLGGDAQLGNALVRLSGGQVSSNRSETDGGVETSAAKARQSFADLSSHFTWRASSLTAGVSFERDDINTRPQFANPLSIAEDLAAAYLIGQTPLLDHLIATASVRADHTKSFGSHATYQFGVVADYAPLRLFASYGTAFKAPSLSERFEVSLFNVGNPNLKPEDSRSWEIGADWRASAALTIGGSYYQTRIDNLIEYDFGARQNINLGHAAINGAEAYALVTPNGWSSVRLSYAWTDARNDDTGAKLLRRPENMLRLQARIRPTDQLALALEWSYIGARQDVTYDSTGAFLSSSARVSAFSVGAVSATYDLNQRMQIFARADNVANAVCEQPSAFASPPRSATIGVRLRH